MGSPEWIPRQASGDSLGSDPRRYGQESGEVRTGGKGRQRRGVNEQVTRFGLSGAWVTGRLWETQLGASHPGARSQVLIVTGFSGSQHQHILNT